MQTFRAIYIVLLAFLLSSCTQMRAVWHFFPDIRDYRKFPVEKIESSLRPYPFQYQSNQKEYIENLFDQPPYALRKVLKKTNTNAFLVFHRDTILYQYYRKGFRAKEARTVFSISKSMVAMLFLDARHRGLISSFDLPICEFVPWLTDPAFDQITLDHLLNMRSGLSIKSKEMIDLRNGPANFYYSPDMLEALNRLMVVKHPPGIKFSYEDVNVQLLMFALEEILQKPFLDIFEERLWKPAGTRYPAYWITDRSDQKIPYAYSGLTCTAQDLARIGLILLNGGYACDSLFCSRLFIDELCKTDKDDPQLHQKWLWWHNVKPLKPGQDSSQSQVQDIYADGFRGQFLYLYPEKSLMIVRTGRKYEYERILFHDPAKRKFKWPGYFLHAAQKYEP